MHNFNIFVSTLNIKRLSPLFKKPDKGDPSDIQQVFPGLDIQLLCCRYWWLKNWEFDELSYPYWRIYYNQYKGASIIFNKKQFDLDVNKIALIPPNTPYSTKLHDHKIPGDGYLFNGARIVDPDIERLIKNKNAITHLFIHFNLSSIYDNAVPGVYLFDTTPLISDKIGSITTYLTSNHATFNFHMNLQIHSFVTDILTKAPADIWKIPSNDTRIVETLNFIEENPLGDLSNDALAGRVGLATNSFTRLFTHEVNIAPQRYVKKRRINKASVMLHHTQKSIDKIASECGFADRYHFSRVFRQINNISPAKYRKAFMMS